MTDPKVCGFTGCDVLTRQHMTLTSTDGAVIIDRPICDPHLSYEFPITVGTSLIVTKARALDKIITGAGVAGFVAGVAIAAGPFLPVDARQVLDAAGGQHVSVVVTDDPALNCAAHVGGGCFRPATPNTIYLASSLRGAALKYVVLHEYSHVRQHAAGVKALDECEADRTASDAGADPSYAHYLPTCEARS